MYGGGIRHTGELSVVNAGSVIWTRKGNQGNRWIMGQVNVTSGYIQFKATRGTDHREDIALDEISFGKCSCT